MTVKISLAVIVAICAAFISLPANAGTKDDVRMLQAQMERVEKALEAQSAATVKISELERQIQQLTGRIEEMQYALDQQNQRLDSISAVLAGDTVGATGFGDGFGDTSGAVGLGSGPVDLATGDPMLMSWHVKAVPSQTQGR